MEVITILIIIAVASVLAARLVSQKKNESEELKSDPLLKYKYTRKQFIMTKAENEFYHTLQESIGTNYIIYPQAHLDIFLDHKVIGQKWNAALSGIQRKSVDFLICNRTYYNPLVAIELDDSSHNKPNRQERDEKVEAICRTASMPLVRVKWSPSYDANQILEALAPHLK